MRAGVQHILSRKQHHVLVLSVLSKFVKEKRAETQREMELGILCMKVIMSGHEAL